MKTKDFIDERGWLKYNGKVFLLSLEESEDETDITFQVDGTACRQANINCHIVDFWETKDKYFNEDFWYSKTSWGNNYPKEIFFGKTVSDNEMAGYYDLMMHDSSQVMELVTPKAKPSKNILKNIIDNACKHSGKKLKFSEVYENTDYGVYWFEAYVPLVDDKDNYYVLTWENCD